MRLEFINTERLPRQHQDTLCREILKVRGYDGLFKSCDVCGADIADDLPEVSNRTGGLGLCSAPTSGSLSALHGVQNRHLIVLKWPGPLCASATGRQGGGVHRSAESQGSTGFLSSGGVQQGVLRCLRASFIVVVKNGKSVEAIVGCTTPAAALQFSLVAHTSATGSGGDSNCKVVFELKTHYSYITCERCGDVRLPEPPAECSTSSTDDEQQTADAAEGPAAPTSPAAAAAAGTRQGGRTVVRRLPAAAVAAAAAGKVRAGESVCPVHLQAVYRLTIETHPGGQTNSLNKVSTWQCQQPDRAVGSQQHGTNS